MGGLERSGDTKPFLIPCAISGSQAMALRRVGFLARARYLDADLAVTGTSGLPSLKSDQFYRKSPITAAREYLELRGTAVPLEEVLDGLTRGGFDFEHQLWTEELRLKNLGISLGKNSGIFHRLPNNTWGLTKKYGIKERKPSGKKGGKSDATETAEVSEDVSTDEQTKTANAE